ncbi:FAD-dependent oxidoreductase [Microbulbifer taiwanensis]|uniref:FAD-dependent oxidoreductase n=1 Tax=Microbulbifer taiwanensis TaxID=986746 RepID=A0ABW1YWD5_9GAMM|nr:FAD-dependent oxidoreductase [Microbulbifer taiwanensis]
MPISLDLLILGGGVQGLALLRELSPDYSALLLDPDPGLSETLHFHGYFSSGWNAAHPLAAESYCRTAEHWRRLLADWGMEYCETAFDAALSPEMVAALCANWREAGIAAAEQVFPAPFAAQDLAAHRSYRFDGDLVFDGATAYCRLRRPWAERMRQGRVLEFSCSGKRIERVLVELDGGECELLPQMLLCACGAGNAGILARLPIPTAEVYAAQLVRPMHMLLMRGPRIPSLSGLLFDLVFVYHPLDRKEGLWILTLNPGEPKFTAGPIDMQRPPPAEPELVCATLDRLAAAIPDFHRLAADCRWSLYVGWKTDAPGPDGEPLLKLAYPRPYHLHDFGLENFLALWPNHWCLATEAAGEAAARVRAMIRPRHRQPRPTAETSPKMVTNRWQRRDLHWRDWAEFAAEIGYSRRHGR